MRSARRRLLAELYEPEVAERAGEQIEQLVARHAKETRRPAHLWDERDAWLIAYPDQFRRPGEPPLATLRHVMQGLFEPWLNGVHVTPFFPWTSDDGFAVTDYLAVDSRYGSWSDVEALARGRRLAVDAVINHLSASSGWFRGFLAGDPEYSGFFRTTDPEADLAATARARAHPLLTTFDGPRGPVAAWTTFSPDQIDLDYRTPEVLLRVLEVLLSYIERGAAVLRLDAVAYLCKQEGTASINLPQTHALIQLIRNCVESVDPSVLVLTETNVPNDENIAYLGSDGVPEAHLAYQFPLPALTLDALLSGDATSLRSWATTIAPPRRGSSFLNFLASHDGIGVRPTEGLLEEADVDLLVAQTKRGGGQVTYRALPGGGTEVYELNTTWYAAMAAGSSGDSGVRRHLASHAIMLALQGIPALYVHSLVASDNDRDGFAGTGEPRQLNRGRFDDVGAFRGALASSTARAGVAWRGIRRMLQWRRSSSAFHPDSAQTVLDVPPAVFALERAAPSGERARVYVNVCERALRLDLPPTDGWAFFDGKAAGPGLALGPWSSSWVRRPAP